MGNSYPFIFCSCARSFVRHFIVECIIFGGNTTFSDRFYTCTGKDFLVSSCFNGNLIATIKGCDTAKRTFSTNNNTGLAGDFNGSGNGIAAIDVVRAAQIRISIGFGGYMVINYSLIYIVSIIIILYICSNLQIGELGANVSIFNVYMEGCISWFRVVDNISSAFNGKRTRIGFCRHFFKFTGSIALIQLEITNGSRGRSASFVSGGNFQVISPGNSLELAFIFA